MVVVFKKKMKLNSFLHAYSLFLQPQTEPNLTLSAPTHQQVLSEKVRAHSQIEFQTEVNCSVLYSTASNCDRDVLLQKVIQRRQGEPGFKYSDYVTTISQEEPNPTQIMPPTKVQLRDARAVIFEWHNNESSDGPTGSTTIQRNGRIRLDQQGNCAYMKQ